MIDNTDLKRLAEALIAATDVYMADECNDYLATNWAAADDAYQKATLPETFLALITENDRLESEAVYSAAGFDAAREEISKLRAEVAGLKTGYEAYERVNAELKAEVEGLRESNDKLTRRNGMLEKNVEVMTETHVLYTWLRKKVDQRSNDVVAVHMNIGHDWSTVHDLDTDLRAMIEREEP